MSKVFVSVCDLEINRGHLNICTSKMCNEYIPSVNMIFEMENAFSTFNLSFRNSPPQKKCRNFLNP
jgi:hypothetical protein